MSARCRVGKMSVICRQDVGEIAAGDSGRPPDSAEGSLCKGSPWS